MKRSLFEPVLGVLIDPSADRAFELGRPPEHAYPHLGPMGVESGRRVVFFPPNGVDRSAHAASGWEYAAGRWRRARFPLPAAVYNRLARRPLEARGPVCRLRKYLGKNRLFFNPRFLAKNEALAALSRRGVSTPRFAVPKSAGDLVDAVRAFGVAYLKPADGSLGRGIAKVERAAGRGRERFTVTANGAAPGPPARMAGGPAFFARFAGMLLASGAYLVQEGVELPEVGGGPADLRALVQRTAAGWSLTGVAGRAALPGHISTHTVRGGRRVDFEEVAKACGVHRAAVEDLVRRAAEAVEAELGLAFFEFSADIAPAPGARLFVLEMNAKPFPFDEEEIRITAGHRLLEFALKAPGERTEPCGIG